MARELLMPKLGLTMTEGTIMEWLVKPGDAYDQGDCLYVVETEKITNDILADRPGTFLEVVVPAGDTVPVGTAVAKVDDGTESISKSTSITEEPEPIAHKSDQAVVSVTTGSNGKRIVVSPLAKRLAHEQNIDLSCLKGTGPNGRIVARDIKAFVEEKQLEDHKTNAELDALPTSNEDDFILIKPSRMEEAIAARLTQSKQETPHFYLSLDVNTNELLALREVLNKHRKARNLRTFTINDFIVKAVAASLQNMPESNRTWSDQGIKQFNQVNVGVAVNTDYGLMAPTVTNLGNCSLADVSSRTLDVVQRTRSQNLQPDDMADAAITISNAGMHNVTYMASIINPGQAMILGVGAIKPIFRPGIDSLPEIRQEMGLVLSADHRIMNGVQALEFLNQVVKLLENPITLLAE